MTGGAAAVADALGYIASALVLWTFSLNSMSALRIVAIASNVMFIAYGAAAQLWPVLLLHAILLPLNGWRLWQLRRAPACHVLAEPPTASGAVVVARTVQPLAARRRTRIRTRPTSTAATIAGSPGPGTPCARFSVSASTDRDGKPPLTPPI